MSTALLNLTLNISLEYLYTQVIPFNLTQSEARCLIDRWIFVNQDPIEEPHCSANWEGICWPATKPGKTVTSSCIDLLADHHIYRTLNLGEAKQICSLNATWLWDNLKSLNECDFDSKPMRKPEWQPEDSTHNFIQAVVCYILFLGWIISLICLCSALSVFQYFRSIRCDRITIQMNLISALALRCISAIIIFEPFIFKRESYISRSVDRICKVVNLFQMYSAVASVTWMFVQGYYIHSRLTTNVFYYDLPYICYHLVGWGVPLLLISLWAVISEIYYPYLCWKNAGVLEFSWIVMWPMNVLLFTNFVFMVNIVRICLRKRETTCVLTQAHAFRRGLKAVVSLFSLLGVNFFFLYNPGGSIEFYYRVANAVSQTTQGVFVSFIYCFFSKDVRKALRQNQRRLVAHKTIMKKSSVSLYNVNKVVENNSLVLNIEEPSNFI